MSYRSLKRVLGETSLERKCRFLFGGGLLLLITGSFYFYAQLNLGVVQDQYSKRADLLITANLLTKHWEAAVPRPEGGVKPVDATANPATAAESTGPPSIIKQADAFKPTQLREKSWRFIATGDLESAPRDLTEVKAKDALLQAMKQMSVDDRVKTPPSVFFKEHDAETKEEDLYVYFRAIVAGESCVKCHQQTNVAVREGDMLGIAKITFPLKETEHDIAKNNAILIAMAIVTCFLAMLGAYAIVRYVIVKPVLHLKDVSDSVAQGDMDQRADIHTGDEFEELSHAFNRMLRHLVTVQEELRQVNVNLDHKVDELARANLSLHEMNKLKSEFLATMSHELRTPLNSILGFSDLLVSAANLNERQKKYMGNIQNSGRSLLTLINDILDLAKIEAGKMEVLVSEFSVGDLIERMAVGMLPLAERKNIELQWDVDPQTPMALQDVGKLQQILYNLLSNAVKFTPEGGRVKLQALLGADGMLELVVADTGIGIPLDDQARIFEKFRQGRAAPGSQEVLTREHEGTGLGLSIVKELSKLLGGEVLLESEFGKGSTFTVRVPVRHQPALAPSEGEDPFRRATLELRRSHPAGIGIVPREEGAEGAREVG